MTKMILKRAQVALLKSESGLKVLARVIPLLMSNLSLDSRGKSNLVRSETALWAYLFHLYVIWYYIHLASKPGSFKIFIEFP